MTSPSCPVRTSSPLPGIAVASTKSTSPPTGVQARPVATPGSRVRRRASAANRRLPSASRTLASFIDTALRPGAVGLGHLPGDLAAHRPDLALELADAGLARVVADDRPQAAVGEGDPRLPQPVALDLAGHEVALGDLELLLLGVAGELDDLHPVAQRTRHAVEVVGRADEHDLREVEGHVEVVVAEGRVLLGVEHLEHRRGGVAPPVGAHLVDLVDHEERVVGRRVAQRADDRAGHRAHVGAPVAADLGLVAHAADGDALEAAPERAGDRPPQRRLADARAARRSRGSTPAPAGSGAGRPGTR